eukprot:93114_1
MENRPLISGLPSTMNDAAQLTLHSLVHRAVDIQPNSEIVTALKNGETHRMTQKQLKYESDKLSLALNAFGVKPGDIIGSFMWSNPRHMMLYQSLPLMGAVLHTINIRLHENELSYLVNHAQDKMVFIDSDILPLFEKIPPSELKSVQLFVICKEIGNNNPIKINNPAIQAKCMDFEHFVAKYSKLSNPNYSYPNLTENSGAVLCYTSGTTGNPKGVLYSHRSIYLGVLAMTGVDHAGISGSDTVCCFAPMFHVMGWVQPFISMTLGNKYLLNGNVNDFSQILDLCLAEKSTIILGVPTVMNMFRNAITVNPSKYKPLKGVLKRAICGGSSPSKDLIIWFWQNLNVQLWQLWGMTECLFGTMGKPMLRRTDITKSMQNQIIDNSTICGIPSIGYAYKIVAPENIYNELQHNGNEMGELLIYGPLAVNRYFRINADDKFDKNGYLRTGDICCINKDETVVIKDRIKDVIKSGGEWISSKDMEIFIQSQYPKHIKAVCVVGVKHEIYRERPIVIIQIHENKKQISKFEIINCLKKKYANFQLPDDILFWDEIPLTGTGKMSKKDVRIKLKNENYKLPKISLRKKMKRINSKL